MHHLILLLLLHIPRQARHHPHPQRLQSKQSAYLSFPHLPPPHLPIPNHNQKVHSSTHHAPAPPTPLPKSPTCALPSLFCRSPSIFSPSAPSSPPSASFPEPMLWFQLPSERFGSSAATPPEGEKARGPTLPTEWEASFSEAAADLVAAAVDWVGGGLVGGGFVGW